MTLDGQVKEGEIRLGLAPSFTWEQVSFPEEAPRTIPMLRKPYNVGQGLGPANPCRVVNSVIGKANSNSLQQQNCSTEHLKASVL